MSWVLNLAPVPADRSGQPSSACKFVLVGLANHAGPDGTGAFPSVATLVRYTGLSERTVRTCLGRLEAAGMIRPCDPDVVAARIKRADRRPKGWDLDLSLIRDDLTEADLAALEHQFPGLRARVAAAACPDAGDVADGVQWPHPARAVDNRADGVQPLHPAPGTGGNERTGGVQPAPPRGAAVAPESSRKPSREPSAAPACGREALPAADGLPDGGQVGEFFGALGPRWLLTVRQRQRLAPAVTAALAAGWTPARLAEVAGANTSGVRNPYAVLGRRLSPGELPDPPSRPSRPAWCGRCNQHTRRLEHPDGTDAGRCARCHPLAAPAGQPAGPGTLPPPGAGENVLTGALPRHASACVAAAHARGVEPSGSPGQRAGKMSPGISPR